MEELYCEDPECDRLQDGHGRYCARCTKRRQRKTDPSAPFAEKTSPLEKALVLAGQLAEAGDDQREYNRLERAVKLACKVLGEDERKKVHSAVVTAGMRRAKAQGIHVGRKPKMKPAKARKLLERFGSISQAAAKARVTRAAFRRALAQSEGGQKGQPL